jgi:heme-degrading monooxygenase HmoA
MFIAMNRFQVKPGQEQEFERVWRERDILLREVPGFVEFHLLKGPKRDDHALYASHTIWSSKEAFDGWTKSEAFRQAHQNAGQHKGLYLGGPNLLGLLVIQNVK